MLYVITGPSGCGKTTLIRKLLPKMKAVQFSVSHTTRKKRNSEKEGRDYYFVSKPEFEQMVQDGKFVEWTRIHGSYYGTSQKELKTKAAQEDLILDIDIHGARAIKSKLKRAVFIFILPPRFEELRRRLEERGDESPASVQKRLGLAIKEIRYYPQFDYVIINDKLDKAVEKLRAIIVSTRCRLESQKAKIMSILRSFSGER